MYTSGAVFEIHAIHAFIAFPNPASSKPRASTLGICSLGPYDAIRSCNPAPNLGGFLQYNPIIKEVSSSTQALSLALVSDILPYDYYMQPRRLVLWWYALSRRVRRTRTCVNFG